MIEELKSAEADVKKITETHFNGVKGFYTVTEDKTSENYTWTMDKDGNIICKNKYDSQADFRISPAGLHEYEYTHRETEIYGGWYLVK